MKAEYKKASEDMQAQYDSKHSGRTHWNNGKHCDRHSIPINCNIVHTALYSMTSLMTAMNRTAAT